MADQTLVPSALAHHAFNITRCDLATFAYKSRLKIQWNRLMGSLGTSAQMAPAWWSTVYYQFCATKEQEPTISLETNRPLLALAECSKSEFK